ncbi:MAG: FAD-dependent monooxygenase, partial [Vicinamibacterales bacterium]
LGVADDVARAGVAVEGMQITSGSGVRVEGRYRKRLGVAVRRRDLDARLVEAAIAAGARFRDGVTVVGPLVDAADAWPRVRGVVLREAEGRPIRLPTVLTIAADGRHSTLAVGLGLGRYPTSPRRWVTGAYFAGVEGLGALGEMHVRDDAYVGVAPLPNGLANVCVVSAARERFRRPRGLLAEVVAGDALLRARFERATRVTDPVTLGPLAFDASAAGCPGLLLAGDAAGFIDPMTGDGVRLAIRGGILAAAVALEELEHPTGLAHVRLLDRRRAEFAWKWRFNRALRALVSCRGGVRAGALAARLAPRAFQAMIAYAGDC